jgi:hypothetical protein
VDPAYKYTFLQARPTYWSHIYDWPKVEFEGEYVVDDAYYVVLEMDFYGNLFGYLVRSRDAQEYPLQTSVQRGIRIPVLVADLRRRYIDVLKRWGLGEFTDSDRQLSAEVAEATDTDPQDALTGLRLHAEKALAVLDPPAARRSHEARVGGRPRRGKEHGPEFYAEIADLYRAALTDPALAEFKRKPNRYIATVKYVEPGTAAKWVARSRELGLLPPVTKGRTS